ncbi:MAG: hypothetical protein ACUVTD_05250 [Nitrososphaerales archaeon]
MSEKIKRIDKQALLSEVKGKRVYVDPREGRVSSKPSEDSVAIPKTTWFAESTENPTSSPLFSVPELREKLKLEVAEMMAYFPDFELYEDEGSGEIFWLGSIDGIGEIKITYPKTYPAQKFIVEALDQEESFTNELNEIVWSYNDITPAEAIIVTLRLFLKKFSGEENAVV